MKPGQSHARCMGHRESLRMRDSASQETLATWVESGCDGARLEPPKVEMVGLKMNKPPTAGRMEARGSWDKSRSDELA